MLVEIRFFLRKMCKKRLTKRFCPKQFVYRRGILRYYKESRCGDGNVFKVFFLVTFFFMIGMNVFSISEAFRRMKGKKTSPERRKILPPDDTGGKNTPI